MMHASAQHAVAVQCISDDSQLRERARTLAEHLNLPLLDENLAESSPSDLLLTQTDHGLELREATKPQQRGVSIDFSGLDIRTGSGNLSRRQPLARAIGTAARTVVDATAGLGSDAILLAAVGYHVTAIERSPILAAMLDDARDRALHHPRIGPVVRERLTIRSGDSREIIPQLDPLPDVIYIDPMFPPKRNVSALPKKSIRIVRALVGDDPDVAELLDIALGAALQRIVVKRPDRAPPLRERPAASYPGKLVRYDMYLPAKG